MIRDGVLFSHHAVTRPCVTGHSSYIEACSTEAVTDADLRCPVCGQAIQRPAFLSVTTSVQCKCGAQLLVGPEGVRKKDAPLSQPVPSKPPNPPPSRDERIRERRGREIQRRRERPRERGGGPGLVIGIVVMIGIAALLFFSFLALGSVFPGLVVAAAVIIVALFLFFTLTTGERW